MATKKVELDSDQFRQEFLECPLCFEKFTEPKVLPCQHTFCLKCLQDYVSARGQANTIPCPLCNKITEIPENDVSKFPNNFTLTNLSDFVKGSVQIPHDVTSRRQRCDACDEVRRLHTFCSTCELWLCEGCTKSHKKVSSTSSHSLSTDMEVKKRCVEIASEEEEKVKRLQEEIKQKLTCLTDSIQKIHSDVDDAKQKIKSAAEEARQVINMKEKTLLQELSRFEEEKLQSQTAMYESVKGIDVNIYNILQVINEVKESSSGRENQGKLAIVKAFLTNTESNPYLHVLVEKCIPVYFNCSNFLADLNNMDIGYLHGVHENINTRHLIDRPVHIQEITSQGTGGGVFSLAYSTFTNKLLAVVEGDPGTVTVINPDSGECKPFLSPLYEKRMVDPRRVAYSEDDRRLFVIEKERGKGVITSYTHDGMFHSIITSSLNDPIDLAVYGDRIFVCDLNDNCVSILNMSGEVVKELKETPDYKALFTHSWCISVGGNGRFAVSDDDSDRVHIFDKDYTLLYTYVTDIDNPGLADVQVLPDGSVVVCDVNNGLHYISPDFSKTGLMNIGNISSLKPWSIT